MSRERTECWQLRMDAPGLPGNDEEKLVTPSY